MGIVSCTSKANAPKPLLPTPPNSVVQCHHNLLQEENQKQQQQQLMTKAHQQFLKRLVLSYCHTYINNIVIPIDLVNLCSKYMDGFLCNPLIIPTNTIKELEGTIEKCKPRQYSSILIQKGGQLTVNRYDHQLIILCYGDIILEENAQINLNGKGSKYGNGNRLICGIGGGTVIIKCYGSIILKYGAMISCDGKNACCQDNDLEKITYGGGGPGGYIYIEVNEPNNLKMYGDCISCVGGIGWESFCGDYIAIKRRGDNGSVKIQYLNEHYAQTEK
eukprot:264212_1